MYASTVEGFFYFVKPGRSLLSSCAWQWLSKYTTKIRQVFTEKYMLRLKVSSGFMIDRIISQNCVVNAQ
jgi:hypothetical protein